MTGVLMKRDPWYVIHDHGFSWDDVNALAAIWDHEGWEEPRAALSEEAAVPLDVERLRQVLRTWEREGHGMLCPSADYIAREYAIRTEREHILADVEDDR